MNLVPRRWMACAEALGALWLLGCSGAVSSSLTTPQDGGQDTGVPDTGGSSKDVGTGHDTGGPDTGADRSMAGCGPGLISCQGACTDPGADDSNCGKCGNICGAGLSCNDGACGCSAGEAFCGAACIDVTSDPNNCGGCGTQCNGGKDCMGGLCRCPSGESDCGNGSGCVDLSVDPSNCGMCGMACGEKPCISGKCSTESTCTVDNDDPCTEGSATNCCASGAGTCGSVEITFGTSTTGSTFENLCCFTAGQTCSSGSACCGFMVCDTTNTNTCLCQPAGRHCVNDADCCGVSCTPEHICGQPCVGSGVGCEVSDLCCETGTTTPGEACPAGGMCP